jgi:hypothetical protein
MTRENGHDFSGSAYLRIPYAKHVTSDRGAFGAVNKSLTKALRQYGNLTRALPRDARLSADSLEGKCARASALRNRAQAPSMQYLSETREHRASCVGRLVLGVKRRGYWPRRKRAAYRPRAGIATDRRLAAGERNWKYHQRVTAACTPSSCLSATRSTLHRSNIDTNDRGRSTHANEPPEFSPPGTLPSFLVEYARMARGLCPQNHRRPRTQLPRGQIARECSRLCAGGEFRPRPGDTAACGYGSERDP